MTSRQIGGVAFGVLLQLCTLGGGKVVAQHGASPKSITTPKPEQQQCTGLIRTRAIRFAPSDSSIGVPQSELLNEVVQILESCPERTVRIEGHTDAVGSKAFNQALSERRAHAVRRDESDGSFLKLSPTIALVTNIDNDHLDYYGTMKVLEEAFVQPAGGDQQSVGAEPGGDVAIGGDDEAFVVHQAADAHDFGLGPVDWREPGGRGFAFFF